MTSENLYALAAIGVVAAVTWILRGAPFLLFGRKPLPAAMKYLGRVLPPAIMTVLVIYCLRNTAFGAFPFGIPELTACALVVALQWLRKNMYLSVIAGTVCYMILLRLL